MLVVLTRHGRDECQQRQQHQCPTHSHHRRYHGRLSGLCQLQSALSISNGITDDRHGVFVIGWRHPGRTRSSTHRHPKWRWAGLGCIWPVDWWTNSGWVSSTVILITFLISSSSSSHRPRNGRRALEEGTAAPVAAQALPV